MGYVVINDNNFEATISIVINFFDLGEVTKRRISFSRTIKLPLIASDTLGLVRDARSLTSIPYTQLPTKYVSNGIELLNGFSLISKVTDKIEMNIYDRRIDFFDTIKNKKLYLLNYLTDSSFHAADIDSFRTNTSGILCPVIDWGRMAFADLVSDFYLPAMSYSEIIQEIFTYAGYTVSGSVLTDAQFTSLAIPYSLDTWEYPQVFRDRWSFYAIKVSSQTAFTVETTITFNGIISEGEANPYFGSAVNIPTLGVTGDYVQLELNASFRFEATGFAGNSFYFRLIRLRSAVETTMDEESYTMVAPGLNADVQLSATLDLRDGDQVYVKYVPNSGTPSITVPAEGFYLGKHTGVIFDNYVFWNYLLPNITMDQIIDDFIIRFGIYLTESRGTITLRTYEDIINQRQNAKDWTSKRVSFIETNLTPPYAMENYFEYNDLADDETLGRGSISINDSKLQVDSTLFSSIFGNSTFASNLFVNSVLIPVYDDTSTDRADFKTAPGLRLVYLRAKKSFENGVIFDSLSRTDYKVAIFEQDNETVGAGFQRFIDTYYSAISLALNKFKGITAQYVLNENDIYGDDFLIFDSDSYYLVKKIGNFVRAGVIDVEMFKV